MKTEINKELQIVIEHLEALQMDLEISMDETFDKQVKIALRTQCRAVETTLRLIEQELEEK